MSLPDRFLEAVILRSRAIIAVMLVITLAIAGGIAMIDDDTSLDQFETDSPELDKLDYIQDNFGIDEDDTTAAQIVFREGNALDRESLIATLELQQELRANETINETLADEAFTDLSMIVAQTAMIDERRAELDERADRLANESEQLEVAVEELERDGERLENESEQLEADQRELQQRATFMTETLNETRVLQNEYDAGDITADERDRQLDERRAAAADELTDEQFAAFEPLIEQARATQAEMNEAQAAYEAGEIDEDEFEQRMADLGAEMEEIYGAIEGQVLAEELADLQERGEELEERGEELEERGEELEARGDELEERGDELEERGDRLEARGEELEERGDELEAAYEQLGEIDPTTEEAIEQLESMSESAVAAQVASTLDEDAGSGLFVFLPTDYEPGTSQADARMLFVTQESPEPTGVEGEAPDSIVASQLAMQSIVDDRFADGFVFGGGIIADEMDRSLDDSLMIVLPLALLFVTLVLVIAYRDLLDIAFGILGIVLVLVWTFGFLGWAGIPFTVVMIAVPVLLVGLGVDYAIHVFMRHREQRHREYESSRRAMFVALGGVGVALLWVTATAVIGFLSNLISPIAPLREFGLTAAFGIVSALLIFGVFIPALKLESDAILESRGIDRRKSAFGTEGGASTRFLAVGQRAAGRIPWVVVVVVLLLTAGGAVAGSQVDTTFEQEDFLADEPPAWTAHLPAPFAPGEYRAKADLDYVNEHFLRQDAQANVLIEGDVTDDRTLERIAAAERAAGEKPSTVILSDGSPDVTSPLSTMESVAEENDSFNETFTAADTTGDGIPDENLTAVYDALFEADENAAADVIYRTGDGTYEAVQIVVSIRGDAMSGDVTDEMREIAASIDGAGLQATATGQIIVFHIIENVLFETVIDSLLITLVAVFAFLMVGYRWMHGSALLGAITLLPIVFAVAWILGTMYLLEIPFNVMTGTITSLTVGLGIAYNIHMSERYVLERRRGRDVLEALHVAVTGTGGALLGSAATTIGGFGVLLFAILPPLQQFGLITGLTILYAFLGSVFVLPSFLVLWTRYLGPPGLGTDTGVADGEAPIGASAGETPGGSD